LAGILFLIVGVDIMVYGELRSLIHLGDERFLVGGVFFVVGIIILILEIKSAIKKSLYN